MTEREPEKSERISPVARQTRVPVSAIATKRSHRRLLPWILAVTLLAVSLMSVLIFLPRLVTNNGGASIAESANQRLQSQAAETEELREEVYQRWLKLEGMNVAAWAGMRSQRALELLQEGERLAGELEHLAALRVLGDSNELLGTLLQQAPGIAADRRAAGWLAYQNGDAETAAANFRVVLAIDPNDEEVREALNRTAYLRQVIELQRQARALESSGDLAGALVALREAGQIDPGNADIPAEVDRLTGLQAAAGFRASMSAAHRAIAIRDYPAARDALARAAALRPNAAEVRDARIQIDVAVRAARTATLLADAQNAEAREHWEDAIGLYAELLQLDPALLVAQQGRDRSRRLASLTTRAEGLLENGNFTTRDARQAAATIIEQIATVEADAPSLRILAQQLEQAVDLSRQPVKVLLQSDSQTEVVVYRVGRLGAFDSHELELMPGRYTVIGTRSGYRDVRAELVVEAGSAPAVPLVIRCEERI